MDFTDLYFTR